MIFQDTDRQLILDCIKGKRNAQYKLYQQYSKGMYSVCKRMITDEMEAEDVLQNSFVDVFTKLSSFKHESTPGAWIKRIVVNNCINHIRKRKIEFREFDNNMEVEDAVQDDISNMLNVQAIKQAMTKLPDGYRIVFSLYALEGYDHSEIAEILSITESTSKSQYSRSRSKLCQIIKESGGIEQYLH